MGKSRLQLIHALEILVIKVSVQDRRKKRKLRELTKTIVIIKKWHQSICPHGPPPINSQFCGPLSPQVSPLCAQ